MADLKPDFQNAVLVGFKSSGKLGRAASFASFGSVVPTILSVLPAGTLGRWDYVTFTMGSSKPVIWAFYENVAMPLLVYGPLAGGTLGFTAMWADHSTKVGDAWSLRPRGGWFRRIEALYAGTFVEGVLGA